MVPVKSGTYPQNLEPATHNWETPTELETPGWCLLAEAVQPAPHFSLLKVMEMHLNDKPVTFCTLAECLGNVVLSISVLTYRKTH